MCVLCIVHFSITIKLFINRYKKKLIIRSIRTTNFLYSISIYSILINWYSNTFNKKIDFISINVAFIFRNLSLSMWKTPCRNIQSLSHYGVRKNLPYNYYATLKTISSKVNAYKKHWSGTTTYKVFYNKKYMLI